MAFLGERVPAGCRAGARRCCANGTRWRARSPRKGLEPRRGDVRRFHPPAGERPAPITVFLVTSPRRLARADRVGEVVNVPADAVVARTAVYRRCSVGPVHQPPANRDAHVTARTADTTREPRAPLTLEYDLALDHAVGELHPGCQICAIVATCVRINAAQLSVARAF